MGNLKPKLILSNTISELRSKAGITQQELADALGVTRATANALERGNYNPSLELALRLSVYFKKNIHDIFKIEGEKYEES